MCPMADKYSIMTVGNKKNTIPSYILMLVLVFLDKKTKWMLKSILWPNMYNYKMDTSCRLCSIIKKYFKKKDVGGKYFDYDKIEALEKKNRHLIFSENIFVCSKECELRSLQIIRRRVTKKQYTIISNHGKTHVQQFPIKKSASDDGYPLIIKKNSSIKQFLGKDSENFSNNYLYNSVKKMPEYYNPFIKMGFSQRQIQRGIHFFPNYSEANISLKNNNKKYIARSIEGSNNPYICHCHRCIMNDI